MTPRRANRRVEAEAGFTLVEALVAFFIVALTLTLGMRVMADGAASARRGPADAVRIEEAVSVMDAVVADPRLAPGIRDGVFNDGVSWRAEITDVSAAVSGRAKPRLMRIALYTGRSPERPLFVTIAAGSSP